jgi:multiple sugar transport system substrate-binding protein
MGGGTYALPVYVSPMVLHYNTALFKEAGISPPDKDWNWQDFLSAAKKITADTNGDGSPERFGFACNLKNIDHMSPFLFQSGGEFGRDGFYFLGNPGHQERNIEAFQFYVDLPYKYHVAPVQGESKSRDAFDLFLSNRIGMFVSWFEATEILLSKGKDKGWDIAECPIGRVRGTTLHTTVAAVSAATKHPAESAKLAAFLMGSPERAMPPFKDKKLQEEFFKKSGLSGRNYHAYMNAVTYAQYIPILESRYQPVFAAQLDQLWIGKMTAKKAFSIATEAIETINRTSKD